MSGSTIGGVIGAVVGAFVGAPQLGFAIGSMLGGAIDPDKVYGPRLSDAQAQTSQVGIPIPIIYASASIKGNFIWRSKMRERKKKNQAGKGGPEQITYHYYRDYAIAICAGPIKAIKTIKRNGKVVYEASANAAGEYTGDTSTLSAASRKFMQKCTIYRGDESQMPDPTIEAIEGVGNVGPNRGIAYIVIKNDDLTDFQGAIPQYDFVVVMEGQDGPQVTELEAPGFGGQFPWLSGAVGIRDPRKPYITYEYGNGATGAWFPTLEQALADIEAYTGFGAVNGYRLRGWARQFATTAPQYYGPQYGSNGTWNPAMTDPNQLAGVAASLGGSADIGLIFSRYDYGGEHNLEANSTDVVNGVGGGWFANSIGNTGSAVWRKATGAPTGYNSIFSFGGESFARYNDFIVKVRAIPSCEGNVPDATPVPDAPGYYVRADGTMFFHGDCEDITGTFKQLAVALKGNDGAQSTQAYRSLPLGPVLAAGDPNYSNAAFWQAAYNAAVAAGRIQSGFLYVAGGSIIAAQYPQLVSSACECAPPLQTVVRDRVALSTIVADLCQRAGLRADQYDVSQLTDLVDGYVVATIGGADSFITPLSQAYFFDVAEWDGKVRFIKRGGPATFTITADDLVDRGGEDSIEETRIQEPELLRKTTVAYVDPVAGFTPSTQDAERRVSTIRAKGESALELPVVMAAADAAKVADKRIKVAWGEPAKHKFSLPYRFSYLTPTDVGYLYDKDGEPLRIRLMESQEDSGVLLIDDSQDSQAAYVSNAVGVEPTPPTVTTPGLIGGTVLVLINGPVLRDEHDQLGLYFAAAGQLPGWTGADIQLSTDGGVTGDTFASVTTPATIGYTLTALAATAVDYPAEQSLDVYLPDPPESVDYATLLRYYNRAFIDDEVIQYQTVAVLGPNTYRLTGLVRNRYDTAPVLHAAGARFVLIDSALVFVQAQQWMLGKQLHFRAVSFGTSADAVAWEPYTFTKAWSQTEWQPKMVRAADVGADIVVSWIARGRLGTSQNAQHSQFFRGYRVTYTNGGVVTVHDVTGTTDTLTGGASLPGVVTITVAGINALTGAGTPSETINA